MTNEATDVRSNANDQIAHAAKMIGSSEPRRKVFEEINRGKKRPKTVDEIAEKTGLDRIRVYQEARRLYNNRIVNQKKINGKIVYEKDDFYHQHKKKILRMAGNKVAMDKYPTKYNPRTPAVVVNLKIPQKKIDVKQLSIGDIDSFQKVKEIDPIPDVKYIPILEEVFKKGLQKVLGEQGTFKDWGGETDDLLSTRFLLGGKRRTVAFALKGRGKKGILTPGKMGKQGDQIQRLFRAPADVFILQYCGQIGESVLEQMQNLAIAKSYLYEKRVYYGIIDGQDTARIIQAYPECFE